VSKNRQRKKKIIFFFFFIIKEEKFVFSSLRENALPPSPRPHAAPTATSLRVRASTCALRRTLCALMRHKREKKKKKMVFSLSLSIRVCVRGVVLSDSCTLAHDTHALNRNTKRRHLFYRCLEIAVFTRF
jgi:hypothetical protein